MHQEDAAAHDLKAKCKKKSGAAKKTCLKKARKHAAQHANDVPSPPPPVTCASGQKPCGGRCIASAQCCTNADCPDFRPHCREGVCGCPPERPVLCGGPPPVCQECCTLSDCRDPELNVILNDGLACQDGRCVCTVAGSRDCGLEDHPRCDSSCRDAECTAVRGQTCRGGASTMRTCLCPDSIGPVCADVCVSIECDSDMCSAPCPTLAPGQECCPASAGLPGLICTQVTQNQKYYLPPG
jgi:hypothetical protein